MKSIMIWKVDTKKGWLVRPNFINDAIDSGIIETVGDKWLVYGMNATTIVEDNHYIIQYKEGIAAYTKASVDAAREIFDIFKE